MRRLLSTFIGAVLRLFFQRVEIAGQDRLPADGPVMFALNHPNALVDPLFLIALAPRPVSFLAKEPLFRMPIIGWLARALDCLPVYRTQDNADPRKNAQTFQRAREILGRGGAIAIFPEGTTHSKPHLLPVKTGAARIALGAASEMARLHVVPTGLYYTQKGIFRSRALVVYGEPITVERVPLDPDGNPPHDAVEKLSAQISDGLLAVTVNAAEARTLSLVAIAARIFGAHGPLLDDFTLRRRMLEGYEAYARLSPERIARLEERLVRYEDDLRQAGLSNDEDLAAGFTAAQVLHRAARHSARFLLLVGPAAVGTVIHYPAYRLIGTIARRIAGPDETVLSTAKILGALLLFPLTWIGLALFAAVERSNETALLVLVAAPLCGWAALYLMDGWGRFLASLRALWFSVRQRGFYKGLHAEREAIRAEILAMSETLQETAAGTEKGPTPQQGGLS